LVGEEANPCTPPDTRDTGLLTGIGCAALRSNGMDRTRNNTGPIKMAKLKLTTEICVMLYGDTRLRSNADRTQMSRTEGIY
jgi:hypothetical protein